MTAKATSRADRRRGKPRQETQETRLVESMKRSADAMADDRQGFPIADLDYKTVSALLIGLSMNAEPPGPETQTIPSEAVKYMATNVLLGFVMGWRACADLAEGGYARGWEDAMKQENPPEATDGS